MLLSNTALVEKNNINIVKHLSCYSEIKVGQNHQRTNGINVTYLSELPRAEHKNIVACPHGPNHILKVPYSKWFYH